MFVDEADFDEDDIQDTYRKNDTGDILNATLLGFKRATWLLYSLPLSKTLHPFLSILSCAFHNSARPAPAVSTFRDFESDDDDDFKPSQNTHTDGAGGGSNNSRARMLAQQREIQMKKRQSSVTSGGILSYTFIYSLTYSLIYYLIIT